MPYEGYILDLETYRLHNEIENAFDGVIQGQAEEIKKNEERLANWKADAQVQTQRISILEQDAERRQKTLEELRGQNATLYKITQHQNPFRLPFWAQIGIGIGIGALGTAYVLR